MNNSLFINEIFSSFQGEGMLAGYRQVFIRLTECNLDCSYCDTDYAKTDNCNIESLPGTADFSVFKQPVSCQSVVDVVSKWKEIIPGAHHSISLTGGEPLINVDELVGWLPKLRSLLPLHLETNGTMHFALEKIIEELDFISMDMKLPSTSGCTEELWDLHRLFLIVAQRSKVSVKIVVSAETTVEEIQKVCHVIQSVNCNTSLFLQPITLRDGIIGTSMQHLFYLQSVASSLLPDVRVIPQMHKLLGVL